MDKAKDLQKGIAHHRRCAIEQSAVLEYLFFKRKLLKGQNHNWKTTTFTKTFVLADFPKIYIYTSSSFLKATMPCEVTRAGRRLRPR